MNVICGGRSSGRSNMMLEEAQRWQVQNPESTVVIVCVDDRECERLFRQSKAMPSGHIHKYEEDGVQPVLSRSQFVAAGKEPSRRGVHSRVFVDNADVILERLIRQRVDTVTLCKNPHDEVSIIR